MVKAGPCRLSFAAGKKLPGTLWKDNLMAHGTARIGKDHYRTEIEVGGHALVGDEGPGLGGKNLGPAPYDFLLAGLGACTAITLRSEEHTSELQSLMRISYAVFCLKKKKQKTNRCQIHSDYPISNNLTYPYITT